LQEGKLLVTVGYKLTSRDVTDHLQLLLRKSGHYLHTSAEKEVVRTIKEKTCYLALNPHKEEKDQMGAWEEFRLPDGKVMRVCLPFCNVVLQTDD
jgi:centractin